MEGQAMTALTLAWLLFVFSGHSPETLSVAGPMTQQQCNAAEARIFASYLRDWPHTDCIDVRDK
jgi:hypothetical protein